MNEYKKEAIKKLTDELLSEGFRVFLAESGTYGFYTDTEGSKIVSFQFDICDLCFSGNYISTKSGSGWRLKNDTHDNMLKQGAPQWAIGKDPKWHYTTLEEQQKRYQSSSRYTELKLAIDKWAMDNLAGNVQRDKGRFQELADDKTAASWGCNCPTVEGHKIAWITLSACKGGEQSTFYDYIKA